MFQYTVQLDGGDAPFCDLNATVGSSHSRTIKFGKQLTGKPLGQGNKALMDAIMQAIAKPSKTIDDAATTGVMVFIISASNTRKLTITERMVLDVSSSPMSPHLSWV